MNQIAATPSFFSKHHYLLVTWLVALAMTVSVSLGEDLTARQQQLQAENAELNQDRIAALQQLEGSSDEEKQEALAQWYLANEKRIIQLNQKRRDLMAAKRGVQDFSELDIGQLTPLELREEIRAMQIEQRLVVLRHREESPEVQRQAMDQWAKENAEKRAQLMRATRR